MHLSLTIYQYTLHERHEDTVTPEAHRHLHILTSKYNKPAMNLRKLLK